MLELKDYKEGKLAVIWYRTIRKLLGHWMIISNENATSNKAELLARFKVGERYVDLYCQELMYIVKFKRWFLRTKYFVLFRFTAVCEPTIDPNIQKAFEKEVLLPDLQFKVFNEKHRMRILISAYFNVVLTRLKDSKYDQTSL